MKNPGIKYGLLAGLIVILVEFAFAKTNPTMLFTYGKYLFWIIYLTAMFKATFDERTLQGGLISFREALRPAFLTVVLASLCYYVFYYLLANYIQPDLTEVERASTIAGIRSMSGMVGEAEAEKAIELLKKQDFSFGFWDLIQAYLWNLVFPGFTFALFVAFLVRRT